MDTPLFRFISPAHPAPIVEREPLAHRISKAGRLSVPLAIDSTGVRWMTRLQGWFYFATGLWPLVHGPSFQAVTGPKADFWLAQTVGAALAVVGFVLLRAGARRRVTREIAWLAVGMAAVVGLADVFCLGEPRTTIAYAFDALLELAAVISWAVILHLHRGDDQTGLI